MATTPKHAAVQADVMRAAEELLAAGANWNDLGIERIALRAGISRTAFYFYFADKRDLLLRLIEQVSAEVYAESDRWFDRESEPEQQVRETLHNIARMYREHDPLLRVIVEVATYDEQMAAHWRGLLERFIDAARERIEREQQAGLIGPMPADAVAFALVYMFERVHYQHQVQHRFTDDEIIEALTGLFVRGVYGKI